MLIEPSTTGDKLSFKYGEFEFDIDNSAEVYTLCAYLEGNHVDCLWSVDSTTQAVIVEAEHVDLIPHDAILMAIKMYMTMNTEVSLYQFLSETFNGNDSGIV